MMMRNPEILHALLAHLTDALAEYVCYQIESGAQVVQLFDSWAHHLSPGQFEEFSMPYAQRVIDAVKAKYPDTPLIFHANGGRCGGGGFVGWGYMENTQASMYTVQTLYMHMHVHKTQHRTSLSSCPPPPSMPTFTFTIHIHPPTHRCRQVAGYAGIMSCRCGGP